MKKEMEKCRCLFKKERYIPPLEDFLEERSMRLSKKTKKGARYKRLERAKKRLKVLSSEMSWKVRRETGLLPEVIIEYTFRGMCQRGSLFLSDRNNFLHEERLLAALLSFKETHQDAWWEKADWEKAKDSTHIVFLRT